MARVTAEEWVVRSLGLLKAEGLTAVQINRLCSELGVTRGSFYWHFADLDGLKQAIAARWCADTRASLEGLTALHHLPARERLQLMTLQLIDDTSWTVERAIRDWSRSSPEVADVIAEGDLFVFGVVEGALLELGMRPADARPTAGLLVYAGIGFAGGQSALPKPTHAEVDRLLDLITSGVYSASA